MTLRVLVTGGSRGIGRAIALRLVEDGCRVVIGYRNDSQAAESVVRHAPDSILGALQADLNNPDEARVLVENAADRLGGLDVLINNAGVNPRPSGFRNAPRNHVEEVIALNLTAPYWTSLAFSELSSTPEQDRSIVMIASIFGSEKGSPGGAAYAAAKAGVVNLVKSLARGLAPDVRVNAVAPGLIETDMLWEDPDFRARQIEKTPLKRLGSPRDVAECVRFLVSSQASFITGAVLTVDGGLSVV